MRVARFCVLGVAGVLAAGACSDTPTEAAPPAVTTGSEAAPAPEPADEPTTAPTKAPTTAPTKAPTTKPTKAPAEESDLSQLRRIGVDIGAGMILDVADDGVDRWLQVGKNGVVDFTGTTRTDSTMMSFQPAPVAAKNRVVIKPPFWNEDTGAGSCVADTAGAPLKLETCSPGKAAQIWQVVPAGDSGQFELRGAFGILRVEDGKLTTAASGRTGLQTLDFAG
ncbi:hypothetical protein AB0J83_27445 [Actinoplanes sp. NPDC049596]|uniref:hypothetical protein n=1 Tax=unclassified Actinoplanes TaxID=2626549 RepID=UPI00343C0A3F